ncbi:HNH endonuclease [Bradyrhizobium sp. AUGA SZCCT0042]|uniref:HNH endonuclease n=1 Tax=Bradyrhizobium sp. AUGA SZCCT0042 TaxID=2807651 RepID=UPI001BAD5666|nr:HNH endonuclease signature motif containing protein [Bradyrhizobium sp. AUGA SZCCT0042]MBR1299332.1 HNH endonuclease [Bradyrhizobium sp. AUGA SZCCT0042]
MGPAYSLGGIRRIEQVEAERLLFLFSFDVFETAGQNEVARLARLGNISTRPNQAAFSTNIRRAYEGKCAFTGCATAEALEAAHIKISEGQDDNDLRNGILLRADIHALFDKGLIALSLDGSRIDISAELSDPSYDFLRTVEVSHPKDRGPSEANIRHHRLRFGFPCP